MTAESSPTTKIVDLCCERLHSPRGMDKLRPRLSWRLDGEERGLVQRTYQIRVGTEEGASDLWDSGVVESSASQQIPYEGEPLKPFQRAYWNVEVRTGSVQTIISECTWWEAGVGAVWPGEWIESDIVGSPRFSPNVPYFRREFTFAAKPVQARLYVTALGLFRAFLNGRGLEGVELAPGWTDYRKRVRSIPFDVTDAVQKGGNCLGVMLADGWYCGHIGWRDRQFYGDRPRLSAFLRVEFEDGQEQLVLTDENWHWSTGGVESSDLLMGEIQDLRKEPMGWSFAGFDASEWKPATVVEVDAQVESHLSPPIRVTEEIAPVSVRAKAVWPNQRFIFDMGQNMVGRVRFRIKGKPGQHLSFRYSERLDEKGNLYVENYRSARSTDYCTLRGTEAEVFEPLFTFHGFQYVEIAGLQEAPRLEDLTGVVLHSDWQPTGSFTSSDAKLNQLFSNLRWGWKGNSLDVPTDCPQRDERLGWTGDAQVFVRTASFLGDVESFFEKFEQDLEDSQTEAGDIPAVAPDPGVVSDGGPAWADAFVIVPWVIYRQFGDREILSHFFPSMKKWHLSLDGSTRDFIRSFDDYKEFKGFGDWLSTNAETSIDLIGTAFYAHTAHLLAKMAAVLQLPDDEILFQQRHTASKAAFQRRFVTQDGLVTDGTQTAYVLALHFDLLPQESRASAAKLLVSDIEKRGWKLSTGFVGTPYLLHVLTEAGRIDVAYKLLFQEEWPSWLYPVTKGATTIWERWDGWTAEKGFQDAGMNSFNHYAYGAVGDWLVSTVAGLNLDEGSCAYKKSVLAPRPGGSLTRVGASLATRYGVLSSEWEISGDRFRWHVSVPPNTESEAVFPPEIGGFTLDGEPASRSVLLGSGRYLLAGRWED